MQNEDLTDPLLFAVVALETANCRVTTGETELAAEDGADFRFIFDIDPGITLTLSCDRDRGAYLVEAKVAADIVPDHVPELALRLNHVLARSRRASRDPIEGDLVVSEELLHVGLQPDDLAMAVTDLVELACGLARSEPPAQEADSSSIDGVIIRG